MFKTKRRNNCDHKFMICPMFDIKAQIVIGEIICEKCFYDMSNDHISLDDWLKEQKEDEAFRKKFPFKTIFRCVEPWSVK